jgi:hypothetical protein
MSTLLHKASPNPGGVCWIYDSDEDACEGYCFHEEKCPYCRVERAEARVKELEKALQEIAKLSDEPLWKSSREYDDGFGAGRVEPIEIAVRVLRGKEER